MTKKTVCITGIAGFIGSFVAKALKERGDDVFGFDSFDPFYSVQLKRDRAAILAQQGIPCSELNLTDKTGIEELFSRYSPTHIVHLAAQAGVRYSLENPQAFVDANLQGFVNILELCRQRPKMPLIYASSSSVYGMNKKIPFAESDNTDAPASLYGATKKCNEVLGWTYHHLFGIPMTGLRFFTVYGPWGRPDMAYSLFTKAILEDRPIQLFNQGQMQRDFTYVDDIVAGILASLDQAAPWAIYNLGNSVCHTLDHFVSVIEKAIGKKAQRQLLPMQPGDVPLTYADPALSKEKLHFVPKVPLEEGLPRFVQWYRDYYKR
jgi:UDP-glucuronate 4-epimerase